MRVTMSSRIRRSWHNYWASAEVALQDPPAQGGWFRQILPIYESVKPSSPDHKTLADQSCGVPVSLGAPVQI